MLSVGSVFERIFLMSEMAPIYGLLAVAFVGALALGGMIQALIPMYCVAIFVMIMLFKMQVELVPILHRCTQMV